jgi:ABC-type multidrug transport system fused ATPase/permease subunit
MINGKISVGVFGSCFFSFMYMQNMMKSFLHQISDFYGKNLIIRDYFDFFNAQNRIEEKLIFNHMNDEISFESVSFKYPSAKSYIFKNLNCSIKKGEHVAIIGKNGSGKSTFAKLLLGMYCPNLGEVRIDNTNLTVINKESFYKKISYIGQDFVKYNFTLAENISISNIKEKNKTERINFCIETLNLYDLIAKHGLDTIIGKTFGNIDLSVGEWQKIAVARGIFNRSEILVLDEPTSALDPLSEIDLFSKIKDFCKDKTLILITHRVGICKFMDKILLFEDGEILASGNHDELIYQSRYYNEFYNKQSKWYK